MNMMHPLGPLADHMWPRFSQLSPNLMGAAFEVMKLFPAQAILSDAKKRGLIDAKTEVIESTSGTFGLALAMLKPYYGYKLTIVSDPVIDHMLDARLRDLGANVDIVTHVQNGSYQVERLKRVAEHQARAEKPFFTDQYNNPLGRSGYFPCADYLHEKMPQIDYLVGTVGTGGSMCGIGERLREIHPQINIIGVDTHCSAVFGQPLGPRLLRGLGNSIIPGNVKHTLFDEIHWVSATEAFLATRLLHRESGLYMGGTSGAAWMVAKHLALKHPEAKVLVLLPDEGYRYHDTIYNDQWLKNLKYWGEKLPVSPLSLTHPSESSEHWCSYAWNQRTLKEVAAVMEAA